MSPTSHPPLLTANNSERSVYKILLTEKMDEGLMLLRRLLSWDLIDVTYTTMLKTEQGIRRWDGKALGDVPHFEDLPQPVRYTLGFCLGSELLSFGVRR